MADIKKIDQTLGVMKSNLRRIETLLESWTSKPLFDRMAKTASVQDFEILLAKIKKDQYLTIKEGGQEVRLDWAKCQVRRNAKCDRSKILTQPPFVRCIASSPLSLLPRSSQVHKLLKDTNRTLKVSQGLPDWKAYVDFINSIIVSGLVDVTVVSLEQLECNLNEDYITKNNFSPLLEIDLDLLDKNVIYKPMVRQVDTKDRAKFGLRNLIWVWISGIMGVGGVFKRLDGSDGTYRMDLQNDPAISMLLAKINRHMHMI